MLKIDWTTKSAQLALAIAERLRDRGGRAFLVGGCVRDAILGCPVKDLDLEVYGLTLEELQQALNGFVDYSPVGMSFGVLKVHHAEIDIALPRRENKIGAGHRGFVVAPDPNMDFEEAVRRRDFTINAMMYDPLSQELIDPLHGEKDLQNNLLRHCSEHFTEDPLRVLRGMQFIARFGSSVAPETLALCRTLSQEELAPERLAQEWEKMLLKGKEMTKALTFLKDCGWVRFYPELDALIGCEQPPQFHPEGDVWTHTLLAMDQVPQYRTGERFDDLCLALGVLCHDFGKPATSVVSPEGKITSHGHPQAGLQPTQSFLHRIWNETALIEQILPLVEEHMSPYFFVAQQAGDRAYRRLALKVKRMDLLHKVARCDMGASAPASCDYSTLDRFLQKAQELQLKDQAPKPLLLGRHLQKLGIKPGPQMGKILQEAFEAQLDGQFSSEETGIAWLQHYLQQRNKRND